MATKYWIGGSGTWDGAHNGSWSLSSGGPNNTTAPTSSDAVIFDANSFSADGQTVTLDISTDVPRCASLDFSALTHTVTLANSGGSSSIQCYGSFKGSPKLTITGTGLAGDATLEFNEDNGGAHIIDQNDATLSCGISVAFASSSVAGSWTLASNLVITGQLQFILNTNTFSANGFNVTCASLKIGSTATFNMGSAVWSIGSIQVTANATINGDTSMLICNTFTTGGRAYTFYNFVPSSNVVFNAGDLTFNTMSFAPGMSVTFTGGSTITCVNLSANGTSGAHIIFFAGSTAFLSASNVSVSYIEVTKNHALGAVPFVDTGGVDNGGNTNWQFPAVGATQHGGAFLNNFV